MFFIIALFIYLIPNTKEKLVNKSENPLLINKKYNFDNIYKPQKIQNINDFNGLTEIADKNKNYTNGELIFIKYEILSFFIFICGHFIILYGAFYYILSLSIHLSLFFYYIFILFYDIILNKNQTDSKLVIYLYFFLVSFLTGIIISLFLKYNFIKNSFVEKMIKVFYGCIFGFFLFKNIICYYFFFINIINNSAYYCLLFISIIAGGFINLIPYFGKYVYLPCSIVSGSYYITICISYILKEYYTDLKFLNSNIKIKKDSSGKYTIKTYLIIQILLSLISIFYQINHINYKLLEDPEYIERYLSVSSNIDNQDITQTRTLQSINEQDETINDLENVNETKNDNNDLDEDEYINDKED